MLLVIHIIKVALTIMYFENRFSYERTRPEIFVHSPKKFDLERFLWGYDVQQLMPRPKLLHYICTSREPYIHDVHTEREWGWGLEMCHFHINIMCCLFLPMEWVGDHKISHF